MHALRLLARHNSRHSPDMPQFLVKQTMHLVTPKVTTAQLRAQEENMFLLAYGRAESGQSPS